MCIWRCREWGTLCPWPLHRRYKCTAYRYRTRRRKWVCQPLALFCPGRYSLCIDNIPGQAYRIRASSLCTSGCRHGGMLYPWSLCRIHKCTSYPCHKRRRKWVCQALALFSPGRHSLCVADMSCRPWRGTRLDHRSNSCHLYLQLLIGIWWRDDGDSQSQTNSHQADRGPDQVSASCWSRAWDTICCQNTQSQQSNPCFYCS